MDGSMLAAIYYGQQDLRVEEYPVPKVGPGEVLIRVLSTGICGTDLRIFHGRHHKYPPGTRRIPGHEVVGEIVEMGSNPRDTLQGYSVGQRVFVAPNMGCGRCRQCISGNNNLCASYDAVGITLDGSFAEYMRVPAAAVSQGNLIPISSAIDRAVGTLIEPFACVLRGQNALRIHPSDSVLIIGAGPIGILHLLLARLQGARLVIVSEINPVRAAQTERFRATHVIDPTQEDAVQLVAEVSDGLGMDAIVVAAPAPQAQESTLNLAAIGGRINFFGGLPKDKPFIQVHSNLIHYKELVLTGTTGSSTRDCWQAADLFQSGQIDFSAMVTTRYPLEQSNAAIHQAESGKALKIVLEPTQP